jgi:hypothetical protein
VDERAVFGLESLLWLLLVDHGRRDVVAWRLRLVTGHDRLALPPDDVLSDVSQGEPGVFVLLECDVPAVLQCVLTMDGLAWAIVEYVFDRALLIIGLNLPQDQDRTIVCSRRFEWNLRLQLLFTCADCCGRHIGLACVGWPMSETRRSQLRVGTTEITRAVDGNGDVRYRWDCSIRVQSNTLVGLGSRPDFYPKILVLFSPTESFAICDRVGAPVESDLLTT